MFSRTYYLFFKQTEVNSWNDMSCVALLSEIEQNILVILKSVCFLFPFFLYEIPMNLFGYQFPFLNWSLLLNHSLLNLLNSQRSLCLRLARTRPFETISLQRIMQHRSSFFFFLSKSQWHKLQALPSHLWLCCESRPRFGCRLTEAWNQCPGIGASFLNGLETISGRPLSCWMNPRFIIGPQNLPISKCVAHANSSKKIAERVFFSIIVSSGGHAI